MQLQAVTLLQLLLAYKASSAPLDGQAPAPVQLTTTSTTPLEEQPGPYTFAPAPVWPRGLPLEEEPGPYKFKAAPVWSPTSTSTTSLPLEAQPGPHTFAPAPIWHRGLPLEEKPGPYTFAPAPVWPREAVQTTAPKEKASKSVRAATNSLGQKGAGMWADWHIADTVKDSGATWAYSWDADPASAFTAMGQQVPAGVEVVPMINAPSQADDATLQKIKSSGAKVVIGYNEPDGAQYSLADAISAWTKISQALAPGLRIGSPAPANTNVNDPKDWFTSFMQQITANGAKVDFICLHHYASEPDVSSGVANFRSYIESVYNKYKLPIWVTEYAMIDYSGGVAVGQFKVPDAATETEYLKQSTAMLKNLPYVERFAWFALPQNDAQPPTNLYTSNQSGWQSTQYGDAYKAI